METTGTQKLVRLEPPKKTSAGPLKLKHWTFAGMLMTYWCNAKCAFCYVYSGPNKKGPTLAVEQALAFWNGLNRLLEEDGLRVDGGGGPLPCKVHFAGGEPFYNFDRLLEIAQAAKAAGLRIFEKVETNAFWAQEDGETRRRIELLKDAGMEMLMISADVYHQEFVPVERCRRAARIAREVMGETGVRVRWWDSMEVELDVLALPEEERKRVFAEALVRHRERLLGRAADQLADFYECHPPEHFQGESCPSETLGSKHVHIDAYGNVFPGVCSGIVWGRVETQNSPPPKLKTQNAESSLVEGWPQEFASVEDLWRFAAQNWRVHPVVGRVVEGGSYRLYEYARELGFAGRAGGYANKCHLCHDVRRWLFIRGEWGAALGPGGSLLGRTQAGLPRHSLLASHQLTAGERQIGRGELVRILPPLSVDRPGAKFATRRNNPRAYNVAGAIIKSVLGNYGGHR